MNKWKDIELIVHISLQKGSGFQITVDVSVETSEYTCNFQW